MIDKATRMIRAADALKTMLVEIESAVNHFSAALTLNGTDSQEADDWLALIRQSEMCIQQFTNAIDDIEGEDD